MRCNAEQSCPPFGPDVYVTSAKALDVNSTMTKAMLIKMVVVVLKLLNRYSATLKRLAVSHCSISTILPTHMAP